jgi:uncharacterized protein with von Willebrand factor type A (vWA) domain
MIRYASLICLYLSISSAMGIGTELSILLDHSGSMLANRESLIESVNKLFDDIQKTNPNTLISLYTFNDTLQLQINRQPVDKIARYTNDTYPDIELGTKFLKSLKEVIEAISKNKPNTPHKIYSFTDGDDEDIRYKKIKEDFLEVTMQKANELNIELQVTVLVEDEAKATEIVNQLSAHHIPKEKITKDIRGANEDSLNFMSQSWSQDYYDWSTLHTTNDSGIGPSE